MKRNAFTLIELLVVIGIIAVLAGLLLPVLASAKGSAQKAVCMSNQRQIAQAIQIYVSNNHDERVPLIQSPMTNMGFGNASKSDDQIDPFNTELWPNSLPNVLMPYYMDRAEAVFACPSATRGWPREEGVYRMTYKPASANQPNGIIDAGMDYDPTSQYSYFRENFGFLDGRKLRLQHRITVDPASDPVLYLQQWGKIRSTHLRDLIINNGRTISGPHQGGIVVVNRNLDVEYRDHQTIQQELGAGGGGGAVF